MSEWIYTKEQEPTTKNDLAVSSELEKNSKKLEKNFGELDCISRAEVLKLMKDNWHTHNGDWAMQESMDDIRALPAVTPQEPRKGHWIKQTLSVKPFGEDTVLCDQCAFMTDKDNTYNFCPNCGCAMIEPQESEE